MTSEMNREMAEEIVARMEELQRALVAREKGRLTSNAWELRALRDRVDRARVMLDLALMEAA